jgi:hypothetical protein
MGFRVSYFNFELEQANESKERRQYNSYSNKILLGSGRNKEETEFG